MIPRRMRRRQKREQVRYVIKSQRPLTRAEAEYVKDKWDEWVRSPRLTALLIDDMEVKEIRL